MTRNKKILIGAGAVVLALSALSSPAKHPVDSSAPLLAVASEAPSPTVAAEPTPSPTAEPTEEPTATAEPTAEPTATAEPTPEPTAEPTAKPTATPKPEPVLTSAQLNAIEKGQEYLDYTSFSRSGLIDQLKYEGFTKAVSTFAVDSLTVNWKEQAYLKAQEYLDYSSFSLSGLIGQLNYEGFTKAQAKYGATKAYNE